MIKVLDPYLQSLIAFGLIIGCLIGGWAIEKFGRKGTTMMCSVPFVLGWILISYAQSVAILYAGRFITGVACGAVSFTAPVSIDDSSLHVVHEKRMRLSLRSGQQSHTVEVYSVSVAWSKQRFSHLPWMGRLSLAG